MLSTVETLDGAAPVCDDDEHADDGPALIIDDGEFAVDPDQMF